MIDNYRLAQKLHAQLVDETSALQQRIVIEEALIKRFGADALPTQGLIRGNNAALSRASESMERSRKSAEERIAENIEAIRLLEGMFEEKNEADIQSFADWIRKRRNADEPARPRKARTVKA